MSEDEEEALAAQWIRGTIRAAMVKSGTSYAALTEAIRTLYELTDESWNEKNVANKVARGTCSATFFVRCMEAMGQTSVPLDMAQFIIMRGGEGPASSDEGALVKARKELRAMDRGKK